jgi:hypothetical protein
MGTGAASSRIVTAAGARFACRRHVTVAARSREIGSAAWGVESRASRLTLRTSSAADDGPLDEMRISLGRCGSRGV